jgi:hypothetical protein
MVWPHARHRGSGRRRKPAAMLPAPEWRIAWRVDHGGRPPPHAMVWGPCHSRWGPPDRRLRSIQAPREHAHADGIIRPFTQVVHGRIIPRVEPMGMPRTGPIHASDSCDSQSRHVQARAWSSWREPSVVRCRTCTADVRVAHRDTRCHLEVGAPAPQDGDAAVVRTMSRRPRTETSSWSVDPWSPLCPSIADHHGVDERSMRGVCPGSRAGTKRIRS